VEKTLVLLGTAGRVDCTGEGDQFHHALQELRGQELGVLDLK
jgi:hypothetical protein